MCRIPFFRGREYGWNMSTQTYPESLTFPGEVLEKLYGSKQVSEMKESRFVFLEMITKGNLKIISESHFLLYFQIKGNYFSDKKVRNLLLR